MAPALTAMCHHMPTKALMMVFWVSLADIYQISFSLILHFQRDRRGWMVNTNMLSRRKKLWLGMGTFNNASSSALFGFTKTVQSLKKTKHKGLFFFLNNYISQRKEFEAALLHKTKKMNGLPWKELGPFSPLHLTKHIIYGTVQANTNTIAV